MTKDTQDLLNSLILPIEVKNSLRLLNQKALFMQGADRLVLTIESYLLRESIEKTNLINLLRELVTNIQEDVEPTTLSRHTLDIIADVKERIRKP